MSSPGGTLLLTGANGSLASAFVTQLLQSSQAASTHSIYTVRDPSKASVLGSALQSAAPANHKYEVQALDLTTLDNVLTFAAGINARVAEGTLPPIRALVLHAAVQVYGPPEFTPDGFESALAVNYLANFLLVLLLLESMDKEHGRILHISSNSHAPEWNSWAYKEGQPKLLYTDFDRLLKGEEDWEEKKPWLWGWKRYAMSKTLMLMFTYELQRRLSASPTLHNTSTLALDPGIVGGSGIVRSAPLHIRIFLSLTSYIQGIALYFWPQGVLRTPAKVGRDTVYASFDTVTLGEFPKGLFLDGLMVKRSGEETYDEAKWRRLWEGSLVAAGVGEGSTALEGWR